MQNNKTTLCTLFGVAGLMACGGGTGTLSLQLTDAPPDTDAMSAVFITVNRVQVHLAGSDHDDEAAKKGDGAKDEKLEVEKESGWRSLDRSRQYDLLKLQNGVTEALGDLDLPPGKITQIRLFLDEAGRNEILLKDGRVCKLDMRHVDKKGIKINHPFKAMEMKDGRTVEAVIDFDVKESVSKEGDCAYELKPVIKLKSHKIKD